MPDGNIHFNSTGNAGLAKGGSGDALTGIITGLLARGYNAPQSALLGVYLHGHAADILAEETSQESILATDVTEKIPYAFKSLESFGLSDGLK
jgi:NAD(P)H-hydrate epimerase